ncbi:MAG: ABC transporter permease [Chloroflexota bacterium]
MTRYIVRRFLQAIPTLLGITIISFAIIHLAPGDPIQIFTFGIPNMTQQDLANLRHLYGLDQPIYVQYLNWLLQILRLNFGDSFVTHRPVMEAIGQRAGNTLVLAATSLLFGLVVGLAIGTFSALRRGTIADGLFRIVAVIGSAVPSFWLGLIFILLFAVHWRVFPSGGMYTLGSSGSFGDRLWHLFPPALILSLGTIAGTSRLARTETLETLGQDFVRTARSKGLHERSVIIGHVLRNSLLPIVTIIGGSLPFLLGGAVLIESIFSWPGIGRLAVDAAFSRDYPVSMGLLVIASGLVVLGNTLSDILYTLVDPRIKFS